MGTAKGPDHPPDFQPEIPQQVPPTEVSSATWNDANKYTDMERVMRFAGVQLPPTWHSGWWFWWIVWRLHFLALCVTEVLFLSEFGFGNGNLANGIVGGLAFGSAALTWVWLPAMWRSIQSTEAGEAYELRRALPMYSISGARSVHLAITFNFVWIGYSVALCLYFLLTEASFYDISAAWFAMTNTPTLSAFILTLSVELEMLEAKVQRLIEAAKAATLTREMYADCLENMKIRNRAWETQLNILFVVTVICSVWQSHLIQNMHDHSISIPGILAFYAKELSAGFLIIFLVMGVNDKADALVSHLAAVPWGAFGSPKESARLDLMFLATTYALKDESFLAFMKGQSDVYPISFYVAGLRLDRKYFIAACTTLFGWIIFKLASSSDSGA